MNNVQKLAMAVGWSAAGFFFVAWRGANLETQALKLELTMNKRTYQLAEKIVTDETFRQIMEQNDL